MAGIKDLKDGDPVPKLPELDEGANPYSQSVKIDIVADNGQKVFQEPATVNLESLNNYAELTASGMNQVAMFYKGFTQFAGNPNLKDYDGPNRYGARDGLKVGVNDNLNVAQPIITIQSAAMAIGEIAGGRIRVTYHDADHLAFLDPHEGLRYHYSKEEGGWIAFESKPGNPVDVKMGDGTHWVFPNEYNPQKGPSFAPVSYSFKDGAVRRETPQYGAKADVDKLGEEAIGTATFAKLKGFLGAKTVRDKGFFDIDMFKAQVLLDKLGASGEPVIVNIAEALDVQGEVSAAMVAIACFGWLKAATDVDFATGEVTFENKTHARQSLERIFQIGQSYADTGSQSVAFYIHGAHGLNHENVPDAYLSAAWAWGAWQTLTGTAGGAGVKLDGLELPNSEDPLPRGELAKEFERQEELNIDTKAFLYFALVKNAQGQVEPKLVTRMVKPEGADKEIPFPVTDPKTLIKAPINGDNVPEMTEVQKYIDTRGLSNVLHSDILMGKDVNYGMFADERYIFTTHATGGEEVLIIRVPTANRDLLTGPLAQGSGQEPAPLGYLTVDEAAVFSAMIGNLDPSGKSLFMSRSGDERQSIYNPVTQREELAFSYSLSILRDSTPAFLADTVEVLAASGYPLAIADGANEKEIIAAARKFFLTEDGQMNTDNLNWFIPGNKEYALDFMGVEALDGLNQDTMYDFDDPLAWADPEGKTETILDPDGGMEPVLGPDKKPVKGPDGNPLMQPAILRDEDGNPILRPATVKVGGIDVPRKRAAYLVAMFLAYFERAETFGMTSSEMRKWQEGLQKDAIWKSILSGAVFTLGSLGGMWIINRSAIRAQRQLVKEAQNLGINDKKGQTEYAKMLSDPTFVPSFAKPVLDPGKDGSPYYANQLREDDLRAIMRGMSGDGGYTASFILGGAGTGKSEAMREIQRRLFLPRDEAIAAGVPESLIGRTIYFIDPADMEADIGIVGTFASKVKLLKIFLRSRNGIGFLDEAHTYASMGKAGDGKGGVVGNTLFQMILPELVDGSLTLAFATTTAQHDEFFKKDPELQPFDRRVKKTELTAYGPEDVKAALASFYPLILEEHALIRFDMTDAREITIRRANGSMQTVLIPKAIEELVNAVAREPEVVQKPNVLMDYSIKRLKEIANLVLSDYANGDNTFLLAEDWDARLPLLVKEKLELKNKIRDVEEELKQLKDKFDAIPEWRQRFASRLKGQIAAKEAELAALKDSQVPLLALKKKYDSLSRLRRPLSLRMRRQMAGLEAAATQPNAPKGLQQLNDEIATLAGDPNLLDIYQYRIETTTSILQADIAMLSTAMLSPEDRQAVQDMLATAMLSPQELQAAQALLAAPPDRQAALAQFNQYFGPTGKYYSIIAEMQHLNGEVRTQLDIREALLKEHIAELAKIPEAQWDAFIKTKLTPGQWTEYEANQAKLEALGEKLAQHQGQYRQLLDNYKLMQYAAGLKTLNPGEITRYKKRIEDNAAKLKKYNEKLLQIQSAATHVKPGVPQGLVIGDRAFRHYYGASGNKTTSGPALAPTPDAVEAAPDAVVTGDPGGAPAAPAVPSPTAPPTLTAATPPSLTAPTITASPAPDAPGPAVAAAVTPVATSTAATTPGPTGIALPAQPTGAAAVTDPKATDPNVGTTTVKLTPGN